MTKTILKWAGNKSKVMGKITPFFPESFNRYLEPFAGSLGAYLHSGVDCGVLMNDLNEEVFNLFECVRDDYEKVSELANSIDKSKENYYEVRSLDRDEKWLESADRFEKAARTVYLNKTCFNGLYRVNKSGQSNVPYGSSRKGEVLPLAEAKAFSEKIKDVEFSCLDYKQFLQKARKGDLIYMDPPYVDLKDPKKEFNGYVGGFGWAEQKELIEECKRLRDLGCTVIVSNSYCEETLSLYEDFDIKVIEAPRYISCKKEGRKPVKEIVAILT
jgi:DNA adenine methylase